MLTLSDPRAVRHCQGLSRRDFLRIGSLGSGGLALADLLAAGAAGSEIGQITTGRSVVLLFLHGGPPQIEFFDPKMSAPAEFRSITGEVSTRLPGVTFGGTFEQLAARTDRFSIIRSYGSKNADHKYDPVVTAGNPFKAAMSAIYARLAGNNHPLTGMPSNVLVLPEAVREGLKLDSNFETGGCPRSPRPANWALRMAHSAPAAAATCRRTCNCGSRPSASPTGVRSWPIWIGCGGKWMPAAC